MPDVGSRSSALGTAGSDDAAVFSPNYTILQRLKFACIIFVIQKLIFAPIHIFGLLHDLFHPRRENRPTLTKSYPTNNSLPIHGGGFALGTPRDNDTWNSTFASHHNTLVIALNYTKSPSAPFPHPIYDLESLISSILSDTSLPIDPSRVALAGFSAGGNLALAVSQLESVRTRICAVIPLYPVVDFVAPAETKAKTRRFKPELGGFRAKEKDLLVPVTNTFSWAYVRSGQRIDHTLLSPYYAEREAFPRGVFLIGCEMDILGQEAWRMACKLAGRKIPAVEEAMGRREPAGVGELILEGDERFSFEERVGGGWYRWLLVPDTIHGFDQKMQGVKDRELVEDARMKTEKVISVIGEWLFSGPFSAGLDRQV
ncbi:Alpha/Beta hydrolase protein [Immersiella caudata]|uniref:Alpha/Beta hydrolase protein n=1 Tax=Immersiella caudata TaxID=314043 RepID=A0AA39WS72_9PEZI|nr:Alpha/Beta hydrolase protein [Immersiella caudata]